MKKNLLSLAIMLPILGFSQLFNFNTDGDKQGWSVVNANNAASTVAGGNYTIVKAASNNPYLSYSGTIDATTQKYLRISLRNLSGFDKFNFKSDTSANIGPITLPTYETSTLFNDYYVDLSSVADWSTNNETALQIRFATAGTPAVGETIEINEIEFLDNIINKHVYNFNYEEQWSSLDGTIAANSGVLVLTPTGPAAKIIQNLFTADATNNKYVHVVYKNNSPSNNQLRFQFKNGSGYKGQNKSISTSTTGFEEVIFDLNAVAEWTGTAKDFQIIFKIVGGNTALDGTLEIDQIVINNSGSNLATTDVSNTRNLLQVYVIDNTLNFKNVNVSKATIFNANGQIVKDTKVTNNNIDISSLRTGVYIVKITAQDGSSSVKKIIKK